MTNSTWIALALAIICWGVSAVLDKFSVNYASPDNAFLARLAVCIVINVLLLGWHAYSNRTASLNISRQALAYVSASMVITTLGVYFYIRALSGAEASKIIPLSSIYPLITVLCAVVFLGEKFSWVKLAGTVLIASGVWLVAL
jgi:transporter family protein